MKLYDGGRAPSPRRVRIFLAEKGIEVPLVPIDMAAMGHKSQAVTDRNPLQRLPVLELDDGTVLVESNAILAHVAEETPWLPPPGLPRTRLMEWLFFEQYSHEPYIAVARNIRAYQGTAAQNAERLARCDENGGRALDAMEHRLGAHDWLTDAGPTVADLALFAYTHVADEGGFDLARWPGVSAWVKRLAALPGIVTLPRR
jgi:glutathione S-transferase